MDSLAEVMIGTYQRYVSPYKGFCCAYRVHTGRVSCSEFAKRAIARKGTVAGIVLSRLRFDACYAAYGAYGALQDEKRSNASELNEPCPLWNKKVGKWCGSNWVGCCWFT